MTTGDRPLLLAELRDAAGGPAPTAPPRLSVVAPVYDERENLRPLAERIGAALDGAGVTWELLLVDDGSRDGSDEVVRELHAADPRVRGVHFAANRGQTAAMAAGIQLAVGELVATIDADLQNDPADLPGLVEVLGDHDAVVGFRTERNDSFVRRASSRFANGVRNRLTGDRVRDTGCSLKVFRAEAIRSVPLFDGMHRFLPTLLRMHGFSVIEHGVGHHPRVAGRSKYGIRNRALRALRDLFAVRWMRRRLIRVPLARVDPPAGSGTDGGRDTLVPPRAPAARTPRAADSAPRAHR